MEWITLNETNLEQEHICCAMSGGKGDDCAASKKAWLKDRFADGLVFRRLDARGKVLIEYLPAEKAWCPIEAEGFLHINCFWVAGKFQGQGYGTKLLESCIADAKAQGKRGLTVLSSPKKAPYLSDPGFLKAKGFQLADTAPPQFELLYLPLAENCPVPRFRDCARAGTCREPGLVLYYTNQCPFPAKYVPLAQSFAAQNGVDLTVRKLESAEQAQACPCPFTAYSLFWNGSLVTYEILSEKKFETVLRKLGVLT